MKILITHNRINPTFFSMRGRMLEELKKTGSEVFVTGQQTGCDKYFNEVGVHFIETPINGTGTNPIADIRLIKAYKRIIAENSIECVIGYNVKPNIYGSIAAKQTGVKRIYATVNGLGYVFTSNDFKTKMIRTIIINLYKKAFRGTNKVFFQNEDDAKEMIARHVVNPDKVVLVNGSGIDLNFFSYAEEYQTNTFFMATRLLVTKGTRIYFEAAKKVKKYYPEAKFYLAGSLDPNPDGIKKEELDGYVQDGTIEYLGVVKDMPSEMKKYAVFVLPSYYREGVPHAILEAMSTGRAIITTNAPGCKETVNGRNGFLIEPRNSEQLAEKMIWMIEHPEEVKRMGAESRKYAEDKFDVEKVINVMLETMEIQ